MSSPVCAPQRPCQLKYDLLGFKWSFLNALSPFFAEWTHLLLSGPHVPLVRADLKAPVQCSPCLKKQKKKKAHRRPPCLPTALLADAGRRCFASLAFVLACRARWMMAANQDKS